MASYDMASNTYQTLRRGAGVCRGTTGVHGQISSSGARLSSVLQICEGGLSLQKSVSSVFFARVNGKSAVFSSSALGEDGAVMIEANHHTFRSPKFFRAPRT